MIHALSAAALVAMSAAAAPAPGAFTIDPLLVDSLSAAPPGLMRTTPYLAHFRQGGLNLYFVSAAHENREDSATFGVIRRAFAAFPIAQVIVEGDRYADGPASDGRIRSAGQTKGGTYQWGETDYAITLAARRKIRAVGGEPTDGDVYRAALSAGYRPEDMLGYGFISMIPSYGAQGRLSAEPPAALFDETMKWKRREFRADPERRFDYESFRRWYKDKMGVSFEPSRIDHQSTRPDPKGDFLQRLGEVVTNVRNRFLADVISRELRAHKNVLVVYGSGHHAVLRRALEAALGKPVYEGDLATSSLPPVTTPGSP